MMRLNQRLAFISNKCLQLQTQTQTQAAASYSRVTLGVGENEAMNLEAKWLFRQSEILGNHLPLDDHHDGGGEANQSKVLSLSLKRSFRPDLDAIYNASPHSLDFHAQPTYVRQQINSWVEVRDFIGDEGPLHDGSVKLVFTNALHFKESWDEDSPLPINEDRSEKHNYVMLPFLAKTKEFDSFTNGRGMLNHPLRRKQSEDQGAFNMLFFYPAKDIEPHIGPVEYGSLDFGDETLMNIGGYMTPKFNMSSEVEASKVLMELGVTMPFSEGKLTNILRSFDGQELYVSNIFQKTFMETNEQGIEAATSTVAIIMSGHRSDLSNVPKIGYEPYYPSLLPVQKNKHVNEARQMAKVKLVMQVVNSAAKMYYTYVDV